MTITATQTMQAAHTALPPFALFAKAHGFYDPEGGITVADALDKTDLGFEAFFGSALGRDDEARVTASIPGKVAVMRRNSEGDLMGVGIVGTRYRIVQHKAAFSFAQNLVDEFGSNVVAASEYGPYIGTGGRALIVLRLPRTLNINDLDVVDVYVMVTNSHDGSSGVVGQVVPIHAATQAHLETAIVGAPQTFTLRHSGNVEGKMAEVEETMATVQAWSEAYAEATGRLLVTRLTAEQKTAFINAMLPTPKNASEKAGLDWAERRADFETLWNNLKVTGYHRDSAYGAFLAWCAYSDHESPAKRSSNPELTRAERTLNGESAKTKHRAWKYLAELTGN